MGKQILIASLLVLLVSLVAVHPVLAATITNPTSISVTSVQVVRNVIETGDICVAFHYNIAYTAYPTTVWASDSFSLNFYNTNGVTVLSPTNPYVYIDNGYNDNLGGFYFNAAAAASMTWGAAYKIGIIPNPADFSSPPANYYYTLQSTDYTTETTQADNQTVIQTYLSNTCVLLEQVYSGLSLLSVLGCGRGSKCGRRKLVTRRLAGSRFVRSQSFLYPVLRTSSGNYQLQ